MQTHKVSLKTKPFLSVSLLNYMFYFLFQYFQFMFYCFSFSALQVTVCIRIVADFGSRIFQFTTNVVADYNVHIYYYFGYYFYTLCVPCISRSYTLSTKLCFSSKNANKNGKSKGKCVNLFRRVKVPFR